MDPTMNDAADAMHRSFEEFLSEIGTHGAYDRHRRRMVAIYRDLPMGEFFAAIELYEVLNAAPTF